MMSFMVRSGAGWEAWEIDCDREKFFKEFNHSKTKDLKKAKRSKLESWKFQLSFLWGFKSTALKLPYDHFPAHSATQLHKQQRLPINNCLILCIKFSRFYTPSSLSHRMCVAEALLRWQRQRNFLYDWKLIRFIWLWLTRFQREKQNSN